MATGIEKFFEVVQKYPNGNVLVKSKFEVKDHLETILISKKDMRITWNFSNKGGETEEIIFYTTNRFDLVDPSKDLTDVDLKKMVKNWYENGKQLTFKDNSFILSTIADLLWGDWQ